MGLLSAALVGGIVLFLVFTTVYESPALTRLLRLNAGLSRRTGWALFAGWLALGLAPIALGSGITGEPPLAAVAVTAYGLGGLGLCLAVRQFREYRLLRRAEADETPTQSADAVAISGTATPLSDPVSSLTDESPAVAVQALIVPPLFHRYVALFDGVETAHETVPFTLSEASVRVDPEPTWTLDMVPTTTRFADGSYPPLVRARGDHNETLQVHLDDGDPVRVLEHAVPAGESVTVLGTVARRRDGTLTVEGFEGGLPGRPGPTVYAGPRETVLARLRRNGTRLGGAGLLALGAGYTLLWWSVLGLPAVLPV